MSEIISHNTEAMRDWATVVTENSNLYSDQIEALYSLVDQFAGSPDFKGGLSTDFENQVIDLKPKFEEYAQVIEECVEIIKERATVIDDVESELDSSLKRENPLG